MAGKARARRYAEAIFEIAREKDELDRWQADLGRVTGVFAEAALRGAMENPRFAFAAKEKVLAERLAGVSALALNLVKLLVVKGRLAVLNDIAAEYRDLVNHYRGIATAEVTSAIALDSETGQRLAERLGKMVGRKVVLENKVDPAILGGFVARIGGRLLDGSTRSSLDALRRQLGSGTR